MGQCMQKFCQYWHFIMILDIIVVAHIHVFPSAPLCLKYFPQLFFFRGFFFAQKIFLTRSIRKKKKDFYTFGKILFVWLLFFLHQPIRLFYNHFKHSRTRTDIAFFGWFSSGHNQKWMNCHGHNPKNGEFCMVAARSNSRLDAFYETLWPDNQSGIGLKHLVVVNQQQLHFFRPIFHWIFGHTLHSLQVFMSLLRLFHRIWKSFIFQWKILRIVKILCFLRAAHKRAVLCSRGWWKVRGESLSNLLNLPTLLPLKYEWVNEL